MTHQDAIDVLVLDSGAFITGAKLDRFGPDVRYVTVKGVLDEIKDDAGRRNLETFPYKIETRQVTAESMQAVSGFARKTGDLTYLSGPDLQVLALAYIMEKEKNGLTHIRAEPPAAHNINDLSLRPDTAAESEVAVVPFAQSSKVISFSLDDQLFLSHDQCLAKLERMRMENKIGDEDEDEGDLAEFGEDMTETAVAGTPAVGGPADPFWSTNEGDEGDWITTDNIHLQSYNKEKKAHVTKNVSTVATVTVDYAMQNVMLTMGLRLLSINGLAITNVRTAMKRCHACMTFERDMERQFCQACGNFALLKVTVSVNTSGKKRYFMSKRAMYNKRGTKYSIPKMKGGRKNKDLKLRDNGGGGRAWTPSKKKTGDAFEDCIEFGFGKTGKKKATQHEDMVFGYGRRNVNVSQPSKRDKNKRNHRRR